MEHSLPCSRLQTNAEKIWSYEQYHFGEKDHFNRRNGVGENHWTGAKSLEWYKGNFIRDVMHGDGVYRWRHCGPDGTFQTYEGYFYGNRMHGYGIMSYPDGRVFGGSFYKDVRWGPGVESQACLREDVGLWRGTQLIRLAWRPSAPNIVPDFCSVTNGRLFVDPFRVKLKTTCKIIGEVNDALELLKQYGCDPMFAAENWTKLFPKHCTDLASQLCHVDLFDYDYYKGKIYTLEEIDITSENKEESSLASTDSCPDVGTYFSWNNDDKIVHMMKHCYKHERQRLKSGINIRTVLTGPRSKYKSAGKHELDCRTLLMASYLGHITNVTQLINEFKIHPDISDMQGNSAVMYATCGDHSDVIHFLVEAGANVDSYNDSCCTPLGVALMRFVCMQKDIPPNAIIQTMIPPSIVPPPVTEEPLIFEWNMSRDFQSPVTGTQVTTPNKIPRVPSIKKGSTLSLHQASVTRKKTDVPLPNLQQVDNNPDEDTFSEDKRIYQNINKEYSIRVNDLFAFPTGVIYPYLFEINNMVKEVDVSDEDQKKITDKNPKRQVSRVIKDTMKPSKEIMWQSREDFSSLTSIEKEKIDRLARSMSTILQLLADGANPNLVYCPQPALFLAIVSGCSDLVRHLTNYGADINTNYPQALGFTALDIAVSRPFTPDNLEIIKILIENGADLKHRLQNLDPSDPMAPEIPGPTLLHVVLSRKTESQSEEEVQRSLLEQLLEHNSDPILQFKGHSAIDMAMKNMDLLDIFIKSPRINLNAVINEANQTILMKMFSMPFFTTVGSSPRLQTITNLLLYGADPLVQCQNGNEIYQNIFVFANKTYAEFESRQKPQPAVGSKSEAKSKKSDKPKKDEKRQSKLSAKSIGRMVTGDVEDYKQALELATECARLLHIRWLQGKLIKELIDTIYRYKHRAWNMILKEHKQKRGTAMWLTIQRCLEVWDILKTTNKRIFNDKRILKHLLCIVQYYHKKIKYGNLKNDINATEKNMIESDVSYALREYNIASDLTPEIGPWNWNTPYVKPELAVNADEKFNVCFECAMPFTEHKILCDYCKLISFCSLDCLKCNVARVACHPCSHRLKEKYFPSPENSIPQELIDHIPN